MATIYLDNNATTRLHPSVFEAMRPHLTEQFGNPSSLHTLGQAARHAVENARAAVADMLHARPREIVFTGGGTESDNLAILGALAARPDQRRIVTTAVEHEAVMRTCQRLQREGYAVTYIGVDQLGRLDVDEFAAALGDDVAVASVMHANNETGVVFPIEKLAEIAATRGVPLHVDAVQSAAKLDIDVSRAPVALLSISAHKMYGPKGVGALYVRRGLHLRAAFMGGHQERDLRPGTENVAGLVGFGAAAALAATRTPADKQRVAALRDKLEQGLLERVPCARVNGDRAHRTFNTTNISLETLEADAIVICFSEAGVCVSAGAACASGSLEASHVLRAMNVGETVAHGGVRFSLSYDTTEAEIDAVLQRVPPLIEKMRRLLPAVV